MKAYQVFMFPYQQSFHAAVFQTLCRLVEYFFILYLYFFFCIDSHILLTFIPSQIILNPVFTPDPFLEINEIET